MIRTAIVNHRQPAPLPNGILRTPRPYHHGNCPRMQTSRKFSTSTMKNAAPSPHTGPSCRTTRLKRLVTLVPATKPRDVAELDVNLRTVPALSRDCGVQPPWASTERALQEFVEVKVR